MLKHHNQHGTGELASPVSAGRWVSSSRRYLLKLRLNHEA
ncbi:hypothetical protein AWB67_05746 [Caballeronia terrestris]|uniref:Uncharacterized protein n=1 Tax=Caballeronia terrestris TaxID=1226301 RepID=A0A158KKF1_9BURK|nr:hypothetical protein AWB67_05746 [Caballeronia terrestris]